MSQILKLANGDLVKNKKQQDLEQIAANRKRIQDAYEAGKLSDEAKAQLDMISQNAQSYLQADPLHNRNARKFQLELTNRMVDIIDGKQGYTPYQTEIAEKNIFDRYSDNEMGLIANELVRQTLGGGSGNVASGASSSTSTSLPSDSINVHHYYDWLGGYNLDFLPANATIKQKVGYLIDGLSKGISDLKEANTSGKAIHGFDLNQLNAAEAKLQQLQTIKTKLENSDYGDDDAFRDLTNIIATGNIFRIPADIFKGLFSKYYGGQSDQETVSPEVAAAKAAGYDIADSYLSNTPFAQSIVGKGKIYSKDGKYFVLNDEFKPVIGGIPGVIDTDLSSSTYNQGIIVDPTTGQIHIIPNVSDLTNISPELVNLIQTVIENTKNKFKTYTPITYDIRNQISSDPLLKHVKSVLKKNFTAYDVSNMVHGQDKVLAVSPSGDKIETDEYGRLKLPDDVRFYVLGEDGKLKKFNGKDYATKQEIQGYREEGWQEESGSKQIGDIEDLDWEKNVPKVSYLNSSESFDAGYDVIPYEQSSTTHKVMAFPFRPNQSVSRNKQYTTKELLDRNIYPIEVHGTLISDLPEVYVKNFLDDIKDYNPDDIDSKINPRNADYANPRKKNQVIKRFLSVIRYYQDHPNTEKAKRVIDVINQPEYQEVLYNLLSTIKKQKEGGIVEKQSQPINSESFSKLSAIKNNYKPGLDRLHKFINNK